MKAFWAFTKKEITEYFRTSKILILGIVFLLFGMMNPVLAKFTPEIIKAAGLDINMLEPTALDAWAQFFKNVGQIGLVVVVVVFSGIMANEFSKGTLINILTKGLQRKTVIFSKFAVASVLWTLSYLFCLLVSALYTAYFWKLTGMNQVFLVFVGPWLYGELLIVLLILGGIWFKTTLGSLLLVGGLTLIMTLISIFPKLQKFNPMTLISDNMALLSGIKGAGDFSTALILCLGLIVFALMVSIRLFDKTSV